MIERLIAQKLRNHQKYKDTSIYKEITFTHAKIKKTLGENIYKHSSDMIKLLDQDVNEFPTFNSEPSDESIWFTTNAIEITLMCFILTCFILVGIGGMFACLTDFGILKHQERTETSMLSQIELEYAQMSKSYTEKDTKILQLKRKEESDGRTIEDPTCEPYTVEEFRTSNTPTSRSNCSISKKVFLTPKAQMNMEEAMKPKNLNLSNTDSMKVYTSENDHFDL
uniref:Col_cuticle_N domain-containing protein n=1 Tax=Rhabditophanes sp. KR3021 TaxID=114890 RepID=A0AC35U3Z0_9BILA